MKFDHIGIFVHEIAAGDAALSATIPIARRSEIFTDPVIKVKVQFLFDESGICYELVAPFGEGNPVDGVLKTRRNVLNHVAYRTADLDAVLADQREKGAFPLNQPTPAVAFGGKRVVFLMTALNFIIELIEA
jgi:methylmalonyl-CoA/ethylmalonyl-CoA epimerase